MNPKSSKLFSTWVNPCSGITSYILSRRIAPIQQSFYFTNQSVSADGRYLWFYCAFPPSGDAYYGRLLGVADLEKEDVRYFPETQFSDASPFVDSQTGYAYWISGLDIWKRSPDAQQPAELVNTFSPEVANRRRPLRIATHLTRSADGKSFGIDAQIGNEWFVGELGVNPSDPLQVWQKFDQCYNHAQFSPTDPNVLLIAQDFWFDARTGERGDTQDRLWLLRKDEPARPLRANAPSPIRGHEWWDAGGQHVWYIQYHSGTHRVNINTGNDILVWPGEQTHSHCDRMGQYFVGDLNIGTDDCRVAFFNRSTGRTIDIATHIPMLTPMQSRYHIHPHPQFCCNDQFVCYTTNVLGTIDVALVPVDDLIDATK